MSQELENLIAGMEMDQTLEAADYTQSKLDRLQQSKEAKLGMFKPMDNTFTKDVLLGLQDTDTYRLANYKEEVRAGDGNSNTWYDGVELKHGNNPYDMVGIDKKANQDAFGKSTTSMRLQRQQVADLINKEYGTNLTADTVTEQDMIDVGNMQQIQTLADAARLPGEDRWQAPLIRGVEQANLTGKGYRDEYGQLVDGTGDIPLNIDVMSRDYGKIGRRYEGEIGNMAGDNVTATHTADPRLNASLYYQGGRTTSGSSGLTAEEMAKLNELYGKGSESTLGKAVDEGLQTVAGGVAGVGQGFVELLDVAQEIGTYPAQVAYNYIMDKNVDIDLIDSKTKEIVKRGIADLVGYDQELDAESSAKVEQLMDKSGFAIDSPSTWLNLVTTQAGRDGILEFISNPSMTANSLTQIAGTGFAGAVVKGGAKAAAIGGARLFGKEAMEATSKAIGNIESKIATNALKARQGISAIQKDTKLTAAQKTAAINEIKAGYTYEKKLADVLKGTTFTNSDFAVRANNHIDAFRENNNGEDPSLSKVASILFVDKFLAEAEVFSAKRLAGISTLPKDKVANTIKTRLLEYAKEMGTDIPLEAMQEGLDAIGSVINEQYGSEKYKDKTLTELLKDNSSSIITQILAGGVAGGHAVSARGIPKVVFGGTKDALKSEETKTKEAEETLKEEIAGSTTVSVADNVTKATEALNADNHAETVSILKKLAAEEEKMTPEEKAAYDKLKVDTATKLKAKLEAQKNQSTKELITLGASFDDQRAQKEDLRTTFEYMDDAKEAAALVKKKAKAYGLDTFIADNIIEEGTILKELNTSDSKSKKFGILVDIMKSNDKKSEAYKAANTKAAEMINQYDDDASKIEAKLNEIKKKINSFKTKDGDIWQVIDKIKANNSIMNKTETVELSDGTKVDVKYSDVVGYIESTKGKDSTKKGRYTEGVYGQVETLRENARKLKRIGNLRNIRIDTKASAGEAQTIKDIKTKMSKATTTEEKAKYEAELEDIRKYSTVDTYSSAKAQYDTNMKKIAMLKKLKSNVKKVTKATKGKNKGKYWVEFKKPVKGKKGEYVSNTYDYQIKAIQKANKELGLSSRNKASKGDSAQAVTTKVHNKISGVKKANEKLLKDIKKAMEGLEDIEDKDIARGVMADIEAMKTTMETNKADIQKMKDGAKEVLNSYNDYTEARDVLKTIKNTESSKVDIEKAAKDFANIQKELIKELRDMKNTVTSDEYKKNPDHVEEEARREFKAMNNEGMVGLEEVEPELEPEYWAEFKKEMLDMDDIRGHMDKADNVVKGLYDDLQSATDSLKEIMGEAKKETKEEDSKSIFAELDFGNKIANIVAIKKKIQVARATGGNVNTIALITELKDAEAELYGHDAMSSNIEAAPVDVKASVNNNPLKTKLLGSNIVWYKPDTSSELGFIKADPADYLLNSSKSLTNSIDLEAEGNKAIKEYVVARANKLHAELATKGTMSMDWYGAVKDLGAGMIYKLKGDKTEGRVNANDYELDLNMVLAIDVVSKNFIKTRLGELVNETDEDIRKKWGMGEMDNIPWKVRQISRTTGKPLRFVDADLGREVLKVAGIRLNKANISEEQIASIEASLGHKVVALLAADGIVERHTSDGKLGAITSEQKKEVYKALGKKDKAESISDVAKENTVKLTEEYRKNRYAKMKTLQKDPKVADMVEAFDDSVNENAPRYYEFNKKEMNSRKEGLKVRRARLATTVGDEAKEAIVKMENTKYAPEMGVIKELAELESVNPEALKARLGMVPDKELNKFAIDKKESTIARNEELWKAYEDLKDLYAFMNDKEQSQGIKDMYFNWFFGTNGRLYLNSATVNPQTEKQLHRWLVLPQDAQMRGEITVFNGDIKAIKNEDLKDTKTQQYAIFLMGVAQSMGYAIDKNAWRKSVAHGAKLLEASKEDILKAKKEVLLKGKAELNGLKIESEHLGHFMLGMDNMLKMKDAKNGKFESTIVLEIDGVTNGVIAKEIQMPHSGAIGKNRRRRGGVNIDGENPKGYKKDEIQTDYIASEDDTYQHTLRSFKEADKALPKEGKVNQSMLGALGKLMPQLKNAVTDAITKEGRNLAKDPTMQSGYGASLDTVRKNVGQFISSDFADTMLQAARAMKEGTIEDTNPMKGFITEVTRVNVEKDGKTISKIDKARLNTLIKALETKSFGDISFKDIIGDKQTSIVGLNVGTDSKTQFSTYTSLERYFNEVMSATYGTQMAEVLKVEFGETFEKNEKLNNTAKAMFMMFSRLYEQNVERVQEEEKAKLSPEELKALGNNKVRLSEIQKREIFDGLADAFPMIKSPLTNGKIEMIDRKNKKSTDLGKDVVAASVVNKDKYGSDKVTIQLTVDDYVAAISSAAVLPTQHTDGAVMAEVLREYILTEVHDALVVSPFNANDAGYAYNKHFYEKTANYNQMEEFFNSLDRGMRMLTKDDVTAINKRIAEESADKATAARAPKNFRELEGDEKTVPPITLEEVWTQMKEAAVANTELKREIFSKDATISQVPLLPTSAYKSVGVTNIVSDDTIAGREFTLSDEMFEVNPKTERFVSAQETAAKRKGTIENIVSSALESVKETDDKYGEMVKAIKSEKSKGKSFERKLIDMIATHTLFDTKKYPELTKKVISDTLNLASVEHETINSVLDFSAKIYGDYANILDNEARAKATANDIASSINVVTSEEIKDDAKEHNENMKSCKI